MLRSFFKRLFCQHNEITIDTTIHERTLSEGLVIITQIKCKNCGKTFPYHPHKGEDWGSGLHAQIYANYIASKVQQLHKSKE